MKRRQTLKLLDARPLSPSVRWLLFESDGEPLEWRAGQFLDLLVPTRSGLPSRRPYSIACAPAQHQGRRLEFAITRVPGGPTSGALHRLEPGMTVQAENVRGHLLRHEPDEAALFVATGSGLAPLRALLQEELARPDGPKVGLLFGCRTEADVLFADELRGWTANPRFKLMLTLSRPGETWSGRRGYVQLHLEEALRALEPTQVYVCGLSDMISGVESSLATLEYRGRQRVEQYDVFGHCGT